MSPPRAPTVLLVLLLTLGAGVLFAQVGPATSTETRYAEMGREMHESGDWLVPTLNGAPLLEKPPFVYWGIAASYAVLGVNDLTPRIPGFVAALLALLVTAAAAARHAPLGSTPEQRRATGALAALALATMPSFLGQAYTISTDIWLVLVTTVGGLCVLEAGRAAGRPGLGWVLLLHASLGVGMLVKGPLPLALVLGGALVAAAWRRDARLLRPFVHPLGILTAAALAVPWYLAVDARIPGTLDALVTRRLFGGLASSAEFHRRQVWIVWLPLLGTIPWLPTLPAAIRSLKERGAWRQGPGLLALCLGLAAPVLFTFSASRLFSYASPAFPWLAVLIALGGPRDLDAPGDGAAERWRRGVRVGAWVAALAAAGVAGIVVWKGAGDTPAILALALAGAGGSLAAALSCRSSRSRDPVGRAALASAFLALAGVAGFLRDPFVLPATKPLWTAVEQRRQAGEELGAALSYTGDWGLFPWYSRSLVRYFGYPSDPMVVAPERFRPERFLPQASLVPWFGAPERRWLLIRTRDIPNHLAAAPRWTVAEGGGYSVLTNLPVPASRP